MRGFFRDAPKAENGFISEGIVSSLAERRNIRRRTSIISGWSLPGAKLLASSIRAQKSEARSTLSCAGLTHFTCILRLSVEEKPKQGLGSVEPGARRLRPKPSKPRSPDPGAFT